MTKTELFHKLNTIFLLGWYVVSIPLIYCDKTITGMLLVAFELVSILMIYLTFRVKRYAYKNPSRFDFMINLVLFIWFLFVTHRDMSTDYDAITKILYVSIDVCSILFLIDTFFGFLIEMSFFKGTEKKVTNNYRCVLSFLCAISFLIYFKYSRMGLQ